MIQIEVERMAGKELVVRAKQFINEIAVRFKELEKDYEALEKEYKGLKEKYEDLILEESEPQYDYEAYNEGFANGEQSMQEKANKIIEFYRDPNDADILRTVFGDLTFAQIFGDIDTAYKRIDEYEKEKEQKEKEIHVGDEVNCMINNHKMIVVGRKDNDVEKEVYTLIDGKGIFSYAKYEFRKTGKHYPLEEILKELE